MIIGRIQFSIQSYVVALREQARGQLGRNCFLTGSETSSYFQPSEKF